jgi:uncharacterized protein (DUF983 family)
MAWFRNHYRCDRCGNEWVDWWSSMCDDDCRSCGARHMSPHDSDDLSTVISATGEGFAVWHSPAFAERAPDYQQVGRFPTVAAAERFTRTLDDAE